MDQSRQHIAGICLMIITATLFSFMPQPRVFTVSAGRSLGMVGGGTTSLIVPHRAQLLAVHRASGGTCHHPGQTSWTYLGKHPCPWSHLAKRVRLGGSSEGGGVETWPQARVSSIRLPSQNTLVGGNSFYHVWLSHVVLEFSNAPCDWLPQAQIGHVGCLSSSHCTPGGAGWGGVTWPPVWCGA